MRRRDTGGGFRSRNEKEAVDLDITPMIDVVFLLLIFFMVTSTMQANPDQDVPAAKFGEGVPTDYAVVVRITVGDGGEPVIGIEKGPSPLSLEELTRYVEDRRDEIQRVIVKADRDIPYGVVRRAAEAVNAVEGLRYYVGVQEQPRD